MPAFSSKEQAASVFTTLFEILLEDDPFLHHRPQREPDGAVQALRPGDDRLPDADGVYVDEVPNAPAITIQMSCTTADALWAGRLLMPIALATRKIKISGSVAKVIEFVPMLQPAFDRYPQIAADAGVNA